MRVAKHLRNVCDSMQPGMAEPCTARWMARRTRVLIRRYASWQLSFRSACSKGHELRTWDMMLKRDTRRNWATPDDPDELASPSGGAASARATTEKLPRTRSLFATDDTAMSRPDLRTKLRKIGLEDAPLLTCPNMDVNSPRWKQPKYWLICIENGQMRR